MEEDILKIAQSYERQIDDSDYHEKGIINEQNNYQQLSKEITSHFLEFIAWLRLNNDCILFYLKTDNQIYEYWLNNIKK